MMYARLILCIALGWISCAQSGTLMIGGSGTDLATFRKLAEDFKKNNPNIDINVIPSIGASGGIKATKSGMLDLCLMSRAPKVSEKSNNMSFQLYAKTPFLFAVNNQVKDKSLSIQQLIDVYAGKKTYWKNGQKTRPILRPRTDSDTTLLIKKITGFNQVLNQAYQRRGLPVTITEQENLSLISRVKGSVGTSTLALLSTEKHSARALNLDGTRPSIENLRNGEYKLFKNLYYCYRKSNPSAPLKYFIDYIHSQRGQSILANTGHLVSR